MGILGISVTGLILRVFPIELKRVDQYQNKERSQP
jgi:hypothetical protein